MSAAAGAASTGTDSADADGRGDGGDSRKRRVVMACDACNRKKVKCDGGKPVCSNCAKSGISCSYARAAKKRGPRAGYIETLETRLKEMEALLQPVHPGSSTTVADFVKQKLESLSANLSSDAVPSKDGRDQAVSLDHGDVLEIGKNAIDGLVHPSDPTLLNVNGRGSADNPFGPRVPSKLLTVGSTSSNPQSTPFTTRHIPEEALRELLDIFFDKIHPAFPVLHRATFLESWRNESTLLLNCMYALAARYSEYPSILSSPESRYNNGDVFYIKAREIVDRYIEIPHLSTVNALQCLAIYAAGSGRGSAAWMYSGMAMRMAVQLKLNIEADHDEDDDDLGWGGGTSLAGSGSNGWRGKAISGPRLSWLEKERRRRTWWVCFILDRYAAAAADRPMLIDEKDCRAYLPFEESFWVSATSYVTDPPGVFHEPPSGAGAFELSVVSSNTPFTPALQNHNPFGYFVLLTKIFGKIVDFTNHYKNKTAEAALAIRAASDSTNELSRLGAAASADEAARGWMREV
ncbi:hypothetical protein HDU96_006619, partial [Phlyctochytrium bullatum]